VNRGVKQQPTGTGRFETIDAMKTTRMRAPLLLIGLLLLAPPQLRAQSRTGPRLQAAVGLAGQRDGDRDLGAGGLSADVGVSWPISPRLRGQLSLAAFSLPIGQGCTCNPGEPPPGVQGTYGLLLALRSVPRSASWYWLGAVGYRRGGFNTWHEHQSASVVAGVGWSWRADRRAALEVRYEHLASPLGATRALLPVHVVWHL
jgi:hypothetical protein